MVPNHIVIYIDSPNRAKFFSSFVPLFENLQIEFTFLTNKLSALRMLPKEHTIALRNRNTRRLKRNYDFLHNSLSVLNGYHTFNEAVQIANDIWSQLDGLTFDMLWIWNGTTTIERALSEFAKTHAIKRKYFEISNIENRIFIDPYGISGDSILFQNPKILDRYDYDADAFEKWRKRYKNKKKEQSTKLKNKIPFYAFVDFAGYRLYNYIREDRRKIVTLAKQRFSNNFMQMPFDEVDLKKKYILLPLQVGNDSQIQLYSSYNNKHIIKEALKIARENKAFLYIKPHPREEDPKEIATIKHFLQEKDVFLVNEDLFDLIEHATKVVVNNSTVGLEAKLLDKEVEVFGDAYYKFFDKERARKYIMNYLPKIEYPQPKIDKREFLRIFQEVE